MTHRRLVGITSSTAFGLLLALASGTAAADAPPGVPARLGEVLNTAQTQGFGGEVLVADADSAWFEQAVGLARRKPDVAHKPGAVWRWGSVSKQVTVTMAMQLVDAGQLKLDDTLAQRWPAWRTPATAPGTPMACGRSTAAKARPGSPSRCASAPGLRRPRRVNVSSTATATRWCWAACSSTSPASPSVS
jgi:CubicO group peptidase (beta-lactamase class C family)